MTMQATRLQAKSLDVPDEVRPLGAGGRAEIVHLGGVTAVRVTFQPGWRWSEMVRPSAGTDLCQVHHVGYVVSGRAGLRMADGTEREVAAGDAYDVPPGHDAWVIGAQPYVAVDITMTAEAGAS